MKVVKRATKAAAFAALALFVSFFAACSGLAGDSSVSSSNNSSSGGSSDKIIVRGSIGVSGAVPKEISNSLAAGGQSQASKSASPTVTTGADGLYYYYLVATQQDGSGRVEYGKNDAANFSQGDNGIVYELGLTEGKWIIECGLKNKDTDAPVLKATSGTLTLTPTNSVINVNLVAAPVNQSGGKGKIYLEVQADSAVDHVNVYCPDFWDGMTPSVEPVGGKYIIDIPSIPGSSDGVPAGVYQLTICFFNDENIMLYETVQDVNVLAGMTTNAWVAGGGSDYDVISDGVFTVGSTALASFKRTSLYVKAGGDPVINDGSHLAPLCTVQAAVNAIAAAPGSQKSDYKIFVSGPVTGHIKFPSTLNSKASSIWITGLSDIDSSADPAVLKGGTVSGEGGVLTAPEVIEVDTSAPIYIKGIKVTKEGARVSRGIKISAENASVTLLEGTVITGNSVSDDKGAGVFVGAGTLYIKGATISENASNQDGGGVYASADGKVVMTSGQISKNSAVGKGGGVYVDVGGTFAFKGGTISQNTAPSDGGGAVYNDGTFEIGGSAYIPYGDASGNKAAGKNDVCLAYDSTNVYKYITLSGALNPPSQAGSGAIATITATGWHRGKQAILAVNGASIVDDKSRFAATDTDFSVKEKRSSLNSGVIYAPIYVAQPATAIPDSQQTGTRSKPFDSVQKAVAELTEDNDTITVVGTISGAQTIINPSCSFALEGSSEASGILNGGGTEDSPVTTLSVNADGKTVVITNLKITGGYSTSDTDGGGIHLVNGTVCLGKGAKVTGNRSLRGGGVYMAAGNLCMYSDAVIGEGNGEAPENQADVLANGGNFAEQGAGIYAGAGAVYLGYTEPGVLATAAADKFTGGIYGNFAGKKSGDSWTGGGEGGGIYNDEAKIDIAAGSVRYNKAGYSGGGIYQSMTITTGRESFMSGGTISDNIALTASTTSGGGGVYANGSFTMTGGTIERNSCLTRDAGGAVYLDTKGHLYMSDKAVIPYDNKGAKGNCVYVTTTSSNGVTIGTIGVDADFDAELYANGKIAAYIVPNVWTRGNIAITGSKAGANVDKFKVVDTDFTIIDRSTDHMGALKADIFVAGTDRRHCKSNASASDSSSTSGTSSHPFKTIMGAIKYAVNTSATEITIDGTLEGQDDITETDWPSSVDAITIKGYKAKATESNPNPTSSAKIDAKGTKSALKITAAKTFTIQDLDITNGGGVSEGGGLGIWKSGCKVTLTGKVKIHGNKVTNTGRGAGVSVSSGAALNIEDGVEIYLNQAASGDINGGGIYNGGTLDMYGGRIYGNTAKFGGGIYNSGTVYLRKNAVIGEKKTTPTHATGLTANSTCSNCATQDGGGIYNTGNTSNLFIGCNTNGTASDDYKLNDGCGVFWNGAQKGGGVYMDNRTEFKIASGSVSYNYASLNGGGIFYNTGGKISGAASFVDNYAATSGGGLYVNAAVTIDGAATFTKNTSTAGGAVYIYNNQNFTMSAGTIGGDTGDENTATNGGAIYNGGAFEVSGSGTVMQGSAGVNDVYLLSGKFVEIKSRYNGSGNNADNKMTLTPQVLKRQAKVLGGSYLRAENYGYFEISDSEWSAVLDSSSVGRLESLNIYVAGTGHDTAISDAPSTAADRLGTKTAPCASISEAATMCWRSGADYKIVLSGELKDATQEIPETLNAETAKTLTLTGYTNSTKDVINRNLTTATDGGCALKISTTVPVTIEKIKITGGYSGGDVANGGGIKIANSSADVTLASGLEITGNQADIGGGVYSKGKLVMSGGKIYGNTAEDRGGGIFKSGGTLYLYGDGIIGNTNSSHVENFDQYSNKARRNGGGIYNSEGKIYIGYKPVDGSPTVDASKQFTIGYNAALNGGGIYGEGPGEIHFACGNIQYNRAFVNGTFDGVGGGIYLLADSLEMASSETDAAKQPHIIGCKAAKAGGAIYLSNTATLTATLTGGTIEDNTVESGGNGGGICVAGGGLTIGGDLYFKNHAVRNDDIYLETNKRFHIQSDLAKHTNYTGTNPIALTMASDFEYGKTVLSWGTGLTDAVIQKFLITNTGWSISSYGKLIR